MFWNTFISFNWTIKNNLKELSRIKVKAVATGRVGEPLEGAPFPLCHEQFMDTPSTYFTFPIQSHYLVLSPNPIQQTECKKSFLLPCC